MPLSTESRTQEALIVPVPPMYRTRRGAPSKSIMLVSF
jgi:hypothetical protein